MDTAFTALVWLLVTITAYCIYKAWRANQYWKEKGIPYVEPMLFIGNSWPVLLGKQTPADLHLELLKQFPNEPFIGIYDFMKPAVLLRDVDLIEKVLIKDFVHFVDRGVPSDDEKNPLDSNLAAMCGKRWKAVRNKLSPIFTTGKLKYMYGNLAECGNELIRHMDEKPSTDIEMGAILERFIMDTMGSCVFGIDARNLSNPENEFFRMGKKALEMDTITFLKLMIMVHFPLISKIFNFTFSKTEVVEYFSAIIKDQLKYRRDNDFVRNDFIQLVIQLQDKGYVEMRTKDPADDYLNIDSNVYNLEKFDLSSDQLTGHAISFLTGGFESVANTMIFFLYELTKHPEIQIKTREEILWKIKQNGSLDYNAIKEMVYLEQCLKETIRKYPPAPFLARICTKEYMFPNGFIIKPGQVVYIPIKAIHYEDKYYSEPEIFKPERFDPDRTLPSCAYLPFGNGPRICIAMRFALLQMKFGLAKLLANYSFTLSRKTTEPIRIRVKSLVTTPNEALFFNYSKLSA